MRGSLEFIRGLIEKDVTLNIASDEVVHSGWNEQKVDRLTRTDADLLILNFDHSEELIIILFHLLHQFIVVGPRHSWGGLF